MTKKEPNLSGTLSEAVSVATSVAYTRQEIQKLKTELVSLLEKKTTEVIVEQVPGPVGPRGSLGATGEQGPKGDKGDRGDAGERGEKGEVGPQGNMGLDGPRGLKGDKGDKGEQGQVGSQGEQGIQGVIGERGPQGLKGDRGENGKNGLDGKDGEAGAIGPVGPAGSQGVQGGQGPKGDKGERGRDGQQGIAGPAGPQGEIGPQGIQGVAGKDGKDGDIKPVEEKFQKFIDNVQRDVNSFKTKVNAAILKSGPNDAWKATGSGEVNLRYLDDVDRDSITDGYVLSYDSANAKFTFVEQGGGDGTDQWARDQANAAYNYANTLALESGTLDTTARTTANSAWYTANLAYVTANSAWATANSALNQQSGDIDPFARSQANSAFSTANASYLQANTATTNASTANNQAASAFNIANSALSIAQSAFAQANTGGAAGTDNLARSIANSAFSTANASYSQANTANTKAQAAYDYANTIVVPSLTGYATETFVTTQGYLTSANLVPYATTTTTNAISNTISTVWATANNSFAQANTATSLAQAAYNFANTIVSDTQIDPLARSIANSAFAKANTSVTYNQNLNTSNTVSFAGVTVTGNTTVQHVVPSANVTYDLGTPTARFRDLYLSGNTINLGGAQVSANGSTINLPPQTKVGNKNLSFEDISTITLDTAITSSDSGLNIYKTTRFKDLQLSGFSGNTINSLSDKTFTSASSITEERFNTTMVCDNPTDILITLPSANSVTVGFNITITKLNVGDIIVENAPETNDVIRYAGWKFDTLKLNYMEDRPLSEFENTKLNGIPNLYSYPVSEFADKYTFKYTCISSSSYMLSI